MKGLKIFLISLFTCFCGFCLTACSGCAGLPEWLGGEKPTYTIVVFVDGTETQVEVEEGAVPEQPETPSKEGYEFKGWYLDEDFTQEYKFDTPLDGDKTLYAQFVEKEYVVTYVVDGNTQAVSYKWSETPTPPAPTKDGFVFKSWHTDEELTQEYVFTTPVQSALTVYAKFVEAYKVEYVVDESNKTTVETELNTAPIKPADPQVEGYDFMGWYLDAEFTIAYNFDTVLTAGSTIYARMVEKEYTVTFVTGENGTVIAPVVYKYSQIPVQPATPTNGGQYFFGWYLDEEYTQSYNFDVSLKVDTTLYAQFLESKPVYTWEELQEIKDYPAGNYTLMNDVILSGKSWTPIGNFSGKFNGNGYKLVALTLAANSTNAGFIQTNNGTIKNLTIENYSFTANLNASYTAGALVGTNNGTIENCHLVNAVIAYHTAGGTYESFFGGLVGTNESQGVIKNSSVVGSATVSNSAGGDQTNEVWLGGCVGWNNGKISNVLTKITFNGTSYSEGWNTHSGYTYLQIGGIVGRNSGDLTKSGFEGSMKVKGTESSYAGGTYLYLGGAVRSNSFGKISECYSKATILEEKGNYTDLAIGGFVEYNGGTVENCYANVDITTSTSSVGGTIGGFVAVNGNPISNSYAVGSITTGFMGRIGGFVALNQMSSTVNFSVCSVDISAEQPTNLGVFVGYVETGSAILICRYNSEASVLKGGKPFTSEEKLQITAVAAEEFYSIEHLVDLLYWNVNETVWVIDGVNPPILVWESVAK